MVTATTSVIPATPATPSVDRPGRETLLSPFETLYDISEGPELPLPAELQGTYGSLRFPIPQERPYVIGNLVTSLDGVVSLGIPGQASGKEISGFNMHDRLLMGLLRAAADAVVTGAVTIRTSPGHVLTPDHAFPSMAGAYQQLRSALGKAETPLNVVVSGSGELGPDLTILVGEVPALVVTTEAGAHRLERPSMAVEMGETDDTDETSRQATREEVRIRIVPGDGPITAGAILDAITGAGHGGLVLVEGGPHLMASFFAEGCLDEMFLTFSPQVVGRDGKTDRPGLVAGRSLAPEHPVWGTLVGTKRAGSHLFLRYRFEGARPT